MNTRIQKYTSDAFFLIDLKNEVSILFIIGVFLENVNKI